MNRRRQLRKFLVLTTLFGAQIIVSQVANAEQNRSQAAGNVSVDTFLSDAFRTAADRASPGLVSIYTIRGPRMTAMWRRRKESLNLRHAAVLAREGRDEQGSGIIIDSKGLILTCNHVVASADVLFVVLPDGRRFEAKNVWGDSESDLAVIRIENAGKLQAVQIGNSDSIQVGNWVVSLGNPYDLTQSISAGIVSATNRWLPDTPHPLIQNDAASNPGSSGGALLNLQGEVIGIITGVYGVNEEFQGIGLAIPANFAKQVVEKLINSKHTRRAYLGCQTQKLSSIIAQQIGLPIAGGLYVKDVEKESPAAKAGIEVGDVLTHFSGQAIDDAFLPRQLFEEPIPGKKYAFTLFRDETSITIDVQMGRPPEPSNSESGKGGMHSACSSEHFDELLGLCLDNLTPATARQLEYPEEKQGVLVTNVVKRSISYKEGVAAGMVVRRFNNYTIRDLKDYRLAMSNCSPEQPILMLLESNEDKHLIVLKGKTY